MDELDDRWAKEVELAKLEGLRGGEGDTVGCAIGEEKEEKELAKRLGAFEFQVRIFIVL